MDAATLVGTVLSNLVVVVLALWHFRVKLENRLTVLEVNVANIMRERKQ